MADFPSHSGRGGGRGRGAPRAPLAKNKQWVAGHIDKPSTGSPFGTGARRGAPDGRWEPGAPRDGRGRVNGGRGGTRLPAPEPGTTTPASVFGNSRRGEEMDESGADVEFDGMDEDIERGEAEMTSVEATSEPILETEEERKEFFVNLQKAREAERLKAIADGKMDDPLVPKRLSDAITMVGTCPDMCPRFERYRRERESNLTQWEMIPGTKRVDHKRAVKMYERAAGDKVLPSDLRPPEVLRRTLDYLFHDLIPQNGFVATHTFVRDRSRAVRNDFTIQHSNDRIAIECHERCARFHILALHILHREKPEADLTMEVQLLMHTLQSLKEYYEENREADPSFTVASELEMRIYHRLIHIRDEVERTDHVPPHILAHPVFVLTTQFRKLVQRASAPISKISKLKVPDEGLAVFGQLLKFLEGEGNGVMVFLVACILDHLFGVGQVDGIDRIRGGLEEWQIIDGISGGAGASAGVVEDRSARAWASAGGEQSGGEGGWEGAEGEWEGQEGTHGYENGNDASALLGAPVLAAPTPKSIFGSTAITSAFGPPGGTNPFGGSLSVASKSPFGAPAPATRSPFGAPAVVSTSSPFEATTTTPSSPFGAPKAGAASARPQSAFAGLASVPNVFANGAPSAFAPSRNSAFGAATSAFGPGVFTSPFGSTPTAAETTAQPEKATIFPGGLTMPSRDPTSSPFAPQQAVNPANPTSFFSTSFKPAESAQSTSTAHDVATGPVAPSIPLFSNTPPLDKNAAPFIPSGMKLPESTFFPSPATTQSSMLGNSTLSGRDIAQSIPHVPNPSHFNSPDPFTAQGSTTSTSFFHPGKGGTPPLSINVGPAVVEAGKTNNRLFTPAVAQGPTPASPLTPRSMPAPPSMAPISLPPTPNPHVFESPAKLSLPNFPRKDSFSNAGALSPLFPASPTKQPSSMFPLPQASNGLLGVTIQVEPQVAPRPDAGSEVPKSSTGLTGVPSPSMGASVELPGRGVKIPLPADVERQVEEFARRGEVVRRMLGRWRNKLSDRVAWLEACRRSEAYSQRVQNERLSSSRSSSVASSVNGHNKRSRQPSVSPFPLDASRSLSKSLAERRVRRKVSTEYKAPISDQELARRFSQKQVDHERRWAKGTFHEVVKMHVQRSSLNLSASWGAGASASAGTPGWTAWLSLNQEHDATAIWLETKFDVPASGEWVNSVFAMPITPPSPPRLLSSPGLVVFECTPLDGLPDALEKKYRVLEDCGRLRDLVDSMSPSRYFVVGILFLVWADGNDVGLAPDLAEMAQQYIDTEIFSDAKVFGVASETKDLDEILSSILRSTKLDFAGERMQRLPYTGICNTLLTPWKMVTTSWIERFSSFTDLHRALLARALEYMIATLNVLIQHVSVMLGVARLDPFPHLDAGSVKDFETLMSTFMNWLNSPLMGKDPIYQNVASDVQAHADTAGEFPLRILPDHLSHMVLARVEVAVRPYTADKLPVSKVELENAQAEIEETLQQCTEQLRIFTLSLPRPRPARRPRTSADLDEEMDSRTSTPKRQRVSLSPSPPENVVLSNGINGVLGGTDEMDVDGANGHQPDPLPPMSPSPAPSTVSNPAAAPISIEMLRSLSRQILSNRANGKK